jgi:hypothetical protein
LRFVACGVTPEQNEEANDMRGLVIASTVGAIIMAAFTAAVLSDRTAAQSPFGDPNAEPAPFNPQMSALMSMLIQPRHTKLGLAGNAENWPLAGYMLKELRQGFAVVSKAVPRWKGLPVPDLVDAAVSHPLTLLEYAIKLNYRRQFDEAYEGLTKGCNACHATTDHAFVVIKVPDASSFPDQEFAPKR